MFRFLLLLLAFIPSSAYRYRRSKYYCFFSRIGRRVRIKSSTTEFFVRNTFATVNTTLTAVKPWFYWRTSSAFYFYLPTNALVSSLKLTTKGKHGASTTYLGEVMTNAQANKLYKRSLKGNKVQLVRRWTNEQFARVVLKADFVSAIVSVSIGWTYAIELGLDQFRLYFPIIPASAWSHSQTKVVGSVVEDMPINTFTVESPVMKTTGRFGVLNEIVPTCERRHVNGSFIGLCSHSADANRVDVSLQFSYRAYKWWLTKHRSRSLPWWLYERQPTSCKRRPVRSRQKNARKSMGKANIMYDLVFAFSYNHTLYPPRPPASVFPGTPGLYGLPIIRQPSWAWASPSRLCWALGISPSSFLLDSSPPINTQHYPTLRRATFFLDDSSGIAPAYYDEVKTALIRVLKLGGTDRATPFQVLLARLKILNDTRNYNRFRIVVLASDGNIKKFPVSGSLFADPKQVDTASGKTQLQLATDFVNALPPPNECKVTAQYSFTQTKNVFLETMREYVALAKTLGTPGKSELSDIFIFSNSKPALTYGNFRQAQRKQMLEEIKFIQHDLTSFTTRSYGQPIFAFAFGPNADFPLLDAITSNNWGRVTMAFETDPSNTIVKQAENFFAGIGRVLASKIKISNFRAFYGFNFGDPQIPFNNSLTDAGYTIPILRDTDYFQLFTRAPFSMLNGQPIRSFLYNFDFVPGGELTQRNVKITFQNTTTHLVYQRGDPAQNVFFTDVQDRLNLSRVFDEEGLLCRYGSVIRVQTFEKALRLPEATTKSVDELNALIEAEGLKGGLETSRTSFIVADLAQRFGTEGGDLRAFNLNSHNQASVVGVEFGLVVAVVFGFMFV